MIFEADFTKKAKTALALAENAAKKMHTGYVGSEHILLGLIREQTGVAAMVLRDFHIEEDRIVELLTETVNSQDGLLLKEHRGYSPRAQRILADSHALAKKLTAGAATGTEHLLLAILNEGEGVGARLLKAVGVSIPKLYVHILEVMGLPEEVRAQEINERKAKKKSGTATLDQYSRDLTTLAAEGKLDPVVGREEEIQRVIQIISRRTKNNPCLVGEPGVGKTAIVEGLASRIAQGDVPDTIKNKRVVTLDLSGMVAGSKYRGEFEERIKRVMSEVIANGNIILFLDEIHTIIGAGGAEGAIDASNILKPSLARGEIQLIGATTIAEYRKYFEKDAALERRFQPVTVEAPTAAQTIEILKGIVHKYEQHHGITILPEALEAAARLSDRYIADRNLPDKAIDLIDEAASAAKLKGMVVPPAFKELQEEIEKKNDQIERSIKIEAFLQAGELRAEQEKLKKKLEKQKAAFEKKLAGRAFQVDENAIAEVVSLWTKIPVKRLNEKESVKLLKLEESLHKRVIGQEEAVSAVSRAIRRGRVGLQDPRRPLGSFLFLGPTGVGKTELSKALAELVFGDENAMIRVDMSEYMEAHSVAKMIGSPPGYVGHDEGGQLSEKVRRNPYSVVLFDEIEKAHPDVFNMLLQVLDDGQITDSKGRKVSFRNTILIMTSNAGAKQIIEPKNLGFTAKKDEEADYKRMKSGVMEEVKRLFKPEFINRIDEMIVFHPLTGKDMDRIISIQTKILCDRCKSQMDIGLTISKSVKDYIVKKHTDLKMGARPLKRAIQTCLEDALADELLAGNISPGDQVDCSLKAEKIVFKKKEKN